MNMSYLTDGQWNFEGFDPGDPAVGIGPAPGFVWSELVNGESVELCRVEKEPAYAVSPYPDGFDDGIRYNGYGDANGRLFAASKELLLEHDDWAKKFGSALLRALQGDYTEVDELARTVKFIFTGNGPKLLSAAIDKAVGKQGVEDVV